MQHCREFDEQLCRFHTGLNKRGSIKSFAIALFTEDKKQIQGTCQTEFMAWKGPEVAYLEKKIMGVLRNRTSRCRVFLS